MADSAEKQPYDGSDGEGRKYESIEHLWDEELGRKKKSASANSSDKEASPSASEAKCECSVEGCTGCECVGKTGWYEKGEKYWESVDATVDGVLGGYGSINPMDIIESSAFLDQYIRGPSAKVGTKRAVDCGAGIGRITKHMLSKRFEKVDLVEPCAHFLEKAKGYVAADKIGDVFEMGLQDFVPGDGKYDIIWNQWCLGHLPDDDLVEYLQRCKTGLAQNGVIFVKENLCHGEGFVLDKVDNSVTRCDELFKELFARAGMTLIAERMQNNFPDELYDVKMYALQ